MKSVAIESKSDMRGMSLRSMFARSSIACLLVSSFIADATAMSGVSSVLYSGFLGFSVMVDPPAISGRKSVREHTLSCELDRNPHIDK